MKELQLTRGYSALLDDADFEKLSANKWMANVNGYQVRACRQYRVEGKVKQIYLHHAVLNVDPAQLKAEGKEVDHINGNPLDNRKENLRIVDHFTNMRNTSRHKNRIGYCYNKRANLWSCYIDMSDKPRKYLGYTKTKEEAELRVNEARNANY
jgi:hypothetical protein